MTATPTSDSGPPLQTLREMFAKDEDMLVTQGPDGTIRIVDKAAYQDLLNVKIAHISFDDEQKKTPMFFRGLVLSFITAAPEVQTFMKSHSIGQQSTAHSGSEAVGGGGPHATGELNNVRLSEALDYMAKTFHGLWVYKECRGNKENKRIVDLWFYRYSQ